MKVKYTVHVILNKVDMDTEELLDLLEEDEAIRCSEPFNTYEEALEAYNKVKVKGE